MIISTVFGKRGTFLFLYTFFTHLKVTYFSWHAFPTLTFSWRWITFILRLVVLENSLIALLSWELQFMLFPNIFDYYIAIFIVYFSKCKHLFSSLFQLIQYSYFFSSAGFIFKTKLFLFKHLPGSCVLLQPHFQFTSASTSSEETIKK